MKWPTHLERVYSVSKINAICLEKSRQMLILALQRAALEPARGGLQEDQHLLLHLLETLENVTRLQRKSH